jgi:hypothetical protein
MDGDANMCVRVSVEWGTHLNRVKKAITVAMSRR